MAVLAVGLFLTPAYAAEKNIFADETKLLSVTGEVGTWSSGTPKGSIASKPEDAELKTILTDGIISDANSNRVYISPGTEPYSDFEHAAVLTFQLSDRTAVNRLVFYAGAGETGSSDVSGSNADLKDKNKENNKNDDYAMNTHQDALIPSKIQVLYSEDGESYSECANVSYKNLVSTQTGKKYQKLTLDFNKVEAAYIQIKIRGGCGSGGATAKAAARIREIEAYCTENPKKLKFAEVTENAPKNGGVDAGCSQITKAAGSTETDAEALYARLTDGKISGGTGADVWFVKYPGKLKDGDGTASLPYVTFKIGDEAQTINTLCISAGDPNAVYQSEYVDPKGVHISYTEDGAAWKTLNLSNMQYEDCIDIADTGNTSNTNVKRQSLKLSFSTVPAKALRIMIEKGTGTRTYVLDEENGTASVKLGEDTAAFRIREISAYYDADVNIKDAFDVEALYPAEVHGMVFEKSDGEEQATLYAPADGAVLKKVYLRQNDVAAEGAAVVVGIFEDDCLRNSVLTTLKADEASGDFITEPNIAVSAASKVRVFAWKSLENPEPIAEAYHAVPEGKINIYVLGESALKQDNTQPGLPQALAGVIDSEAAELRTDYRSNDASAVGLIDGGKMNELLNDVRCGDYVIIGLAANDRYWNMTQAGENGTYEYTLSRIIDMVRRKGGKPILVTPVSRKTSEGYENTYGGFTNDIKKIGTEKHVPILDAASVTLSSLNNLEAETTASYYSDEYHLTENGVSWLSGLLREEIERIRLPLPTVGD